MTLTLPQDAEPFGDDWTRPGVYAIQYAKPADIAAAWDSYYEARPRWFDQLEAATHILYVGEAGNVMRRLEDHADAEKRRTTLSRIGCEPVGIEAIDYHDSKEAAEHAEYNTAVRLNEQTGENTLVLCNGEPV